jgi:hypothetical protein
MASHFPVFLGPMAAMNLQKRIVRQAVVSVANSTFRVGRPTFCLNALLCMSTCNSQVCHISHNHMCVACGQVLAKEALPPLSTCFIYHVWTFCSAVLLLSAQVCWTCPNQAPAWSAQQAKRPHHFHQPQVRQQPLTPCAASSTLPASSYQITTLPSDE